MKPVISPELDEFNHIFQEFDDIFHDIALHLGLSDSAFTILYDIFWLGDGCLQRDICQTSHISKQTVNSSIRKLKQEGYLYLEPGKGRDMHIHLTPAGTKMMTEKILPVITMENHAFAGMPAVERVKLLELSRKYMNIFRQEVQKYLDTDIEEDL